tara:strand:+ start:77 stop:820 length:744 start_codon:yes stop_codon:yes gene_type:complete
MELDDVILEKVKKNMDFIDDIYNNYEYLHFVFYNISNFDENKIIQYLFALENDKWILPNLKYNNIDTLLSNINKIYTNIDRNINGKSKYLGYMNYEKDIYLFYKVEYFNIIDKIDYYFGSYYEILLSNHMYDYVFKSQIKEFYIKNKDTLFITTLDSENIRERDPIVLYQNVDKMEIQHVMFFGPTRVDNKYILFHKINKIKNKIMVRFLVFETDIKFKDSCCDTLIYEGNKSILYNTNNVYFHSIM